jgi:arabinofuranan 3-O-arabinosyltransferase
MVVDNFSCDRTEEIAKRHNCTFVRRRAQRSEARNHGANLAKGEYYFFVDSDMELFPRAIEECIDTMVSDSSVKALIGPEYSSGSGFWAKCKELERQLNLGYEAVEAPRFFSKDAFETAGRYDQNLEAGEDWDLFQRVKRVGTVSRVGTGWVHHEGSLTMRYLITSKYHYGKSIWKYLGKRRPNGKPFILLEQCFFLRPRYLKKGRLLATNPLITMGFALTKSMELAAAGSGLLAGRLSRTNRKGPN